MNEGTPFSVLVLCTGNSARSQIGEALLTTRGASRHARRVVAASAGSRPAARVNPFAVEVLADRGIAWNGRVPQHIDAVLDQPFDLVITVCDNALEACPYLPGASARVHWGLPDPADVDTPDLAREAFAQTFNALAERVEALLAEPLEQLEPEVLSSRAARIHESCRIPRW